MAINKRLINPGFEAPTPPVPTSFNTVLYTGNATARSITGLGFQPDLVWTKTRSVANRHELADSLRGSTHRLFSNLTSSEGIDPNAITSFTADGFNLGSSDNVNWNGQTYVAWCWKAGGAAVTNTDGTITSEVSANPEAGFSIVSYTGDGANGTVGHGLGTTPNIVLIKRRNSTSNWSFNGNIGGLIYGTNKLSLNDTAAIAGLTNQVLAANSNTFTAGTSTAIGTSGGTYVAYCFAEVAGFSKFGSYGGGGATDVTVNLGFEPAFLMIKSAGEAGVWLMYDNKRTQPEPNPIGGLYANTRGAETGWPASEFDFTPTGFTVSRYNQPDDYDNNNSGITYIYMAFANQF